MKTDGPLVIDDRLREMISSILERSRRNPMKTDRGFSSKDTGDLTLEQREKWIEENGQPETECIDLGGVLRLCLGYEEQPIGLCLHVSVSYHEPGELPAIPVVIQLGMTCGIDFPDHIWLEEFAPDHRAVNVIKLVGSIGTTN